MVSILLLHLNFLPGAPPYNGFQFTLLLKFPSPALQHTMVSILLLYLNFPPPRVLHQTLLSMKLLY